eukprot:scaffold79282_cov29-Tisochrysis_lutea.AAC.3
MEAVILAAARFSIDGASRGVSCLSAMRWPSLSSPSPRTAADATCNSSKIAGGMEGTSITMAPARRGDGPQAETSASA